MSRPGSFGDRPPTDTPIGDPEPARLVRFEPSEIALHWALVLPYLTLAVSGLLLILQKNLDLDWAPREMLKDVHLIAGAALIVLPSFVLMATNPMPYLRNLREAFTWHWKDLRWLFASGLRLLIPRLTLPPAGRFNAGQKLNLVHVTLFVPALTVTGIVLWSDGADILLLRLVHVALAALSLSLASGHMYLALVHPSTRPARGAMFHGRVSAGYARSHHPLWYESVTGVSCPAVARAGRTVSVFGFSLGVAFAAFVLIGATPKEAGGPEDPEIDRDASREVLSFLSPGPLHPLHADVPELASCSACHARYGAVSSESCLECHEKVARRLEAKAGFHGTLDGECSGCHADHVSRLITMDDREFNHDLALFRLEGAHRDLDCGKCHERDGASRDYLEIAHEDCGDCHQNVHIPPVQTACAHCHRQDTWNELLPAFDHDRDTSFALDAAHRRVECAACHQREDQREDQQRPPRLKGTPDSCEECHGDVAATIAGRWPDGSVAAAASPHHREVTCVECHRTEPRDEVARCSSCHPADYDRLFVDWQARVELELLGLDDASVAGRWRRQGKHHWEGVVDRLRR